MLNIKHGVAADVGGHLTDSLHTTELQSDLPSPPLPRYALLRISVHAS